MIKNYIFIYSMQNFVFISYSSPNRENAESIRDFFHFNNTECWMAPYDIPSGQSYADNINKAIRSCTCFFLLLTKESMNSNHVEKEIDLAVNYNKQIVILKIGNFTLSDSFRYYLGNCQFIEDRRFSLDSIAFEQVYKRICELRNAPMPIFQQKSHTSSVLKILVVCLVSICLVLGLILVYLNKKSLFFEKTSKIQ